MANAPNNLPDMDEDENTDHFTNLQNEIEPIPSLNIIEPGNLYLLFKIISYLYY